MKRHRIIIGVGLLTVIGAVLWLGFAEVLTRRSIDPVDGKDLGYAREVEAILEGQAWYAPILYSGVTIEDNEATVWVRGPLPDSLYSSIGGYSQSGLLVIQPCPRGFERIEIRHSVFGNELAPALNQRDR